MASAASYPDRKPVSAIRPTISHIQRSEQPPSPHTPQRTISSTFSSPSASYRAEEETIVFEFGTRYFRAGIAGEGAPRCVSGFGPESSRRVGDYRQWLPGYENRNRKRKREQDWGDEYALWRMDLRTLELGLVEDKIERAVRDAYSKYLLLDSKTRRLLVVLPSVMPHPLLSIILSTLFHNFQCPGITLLSAPVLSVVAAGLRSGLVVDVGWSETTITGVYELREVQQYKTTRATRLATWEMGKLLQKYLRHSQGKQVQEQPQSEMEDELLEIDFEHAEEVTMRMAWCRTSSEIYKHSPRPSDLAGHLGNLQIARDGSHDKQTSYDTLIDDTPVAIPLPSSTSQTPQISFSSISDTIEFALFAKDQNPHDLDDHEQALHHLTYKALLALPPDVRGVCMSRIIITGGGSNIPGLKTRLLEEVSGLVENRGWDSVWGKAADERRRRLKEIHINRQAPLAKVDANFLSTAVPDGQVPDGTAQVAAAFTPQILDPIEEKLRRDRSKGTKPLISGVIRGVETLGPWVGGSLVAGLRIEGIVEIERDSFLQHGLAGAKRDADISIVSNRQSFGPGISRAGGGDKTGWTLGAWA
ncbi:hypothetical protein MMC24_000634 [Lignoscripta atroalba]|nr:hypothetical protein [Lignoscripta atroalba]